MEHEIRRGQSNRPLSPFPFPFPSFSLSPGPASRSSFNLHPLSSLSSTSPPRDAFTPTYTHTQPTNMAAAAAASSSAAARYPAQKPASHPRAQPFLGRELWEEFKPPDDRASATYWFHGIVSAIERERVDGDTVTWVTCTFEDGDQYTVDTDAFKQRLEARRSGVVPSILWDPPGNDPPVHPNEAQRNVWGNWLYVRRAPTRMRGIGLARALSNAGCKHTLGKLRKEAQAYREQRLRAATATPAPSAVYAAVQAAAYNPMQPTSRPARAEPAPTPKPPTPTPTPKPTPPTPKPKEGVYAHPLVSIAVSWGYLESDAVSTLKDIIRGLEMTINEVNEYNLLDPTDVDVLDDFLGRLQKCKADRQAAEEIRDAEAMRKKEQEKLRHEKAAEQVCSLCGCSPEEKEDDESRRMKKSARARLKEGEANRFTACPHCRGVACLACFKVQLFNKRSCPFCRGTLLGVSALVEPSPRPNNDDDGDDAGGAKRLETDAAASNGKVQAPAPAVATKQPGGTSALPSPSFPSLLSKRPREQAADASVVRKIPRKAHAESTAAANAPPPPPPGAAAGAGAGAGSVPAKPFNIPRKEKNVQATVEPAPQQLKPMPTPTPAPTPTPTPPKPIVAKQTAREKRRWVCRHWKGAPGGCWQGDACKFAHGEAAIGTFEGNPHYRPGETPSISAPPPLQAATTNAAAAAGAGTGAGASVPLQQQIWQPYSDGYGPPGVSTMHMGMMPSFKVREGTFTPNMNGAHARFDTSGSKVVAAGTGAARYPPPPSTAVVASNIASAGAATMPRSALKPPSTTRGSVRISFPCRCIHVKTCACVEWVGAPSAPASTPAAEDGGWERDCNDGGATIAQWQAAQEAFRGSMPWM